MNIKYDVAILGGGFVGHALLRICIKLGLSVCLVEAKPPIHSSSSDGRAIALSYSSIALLKKINVWDMLSEHATPIERVQVSSKGHFGTMNCDAQDIDIPYLGQVIPAPLLGSVLSSPTFKEAAEYAQAGVLGSLPTFKEAAEYAQAGVLGSLPPFKGAAEYSEAGVFLNSTVTALHSHSDHATITLSDQEITASLVLACDGTESFCRDYLHIDAEDKPSHKKALVTNILLDKPHNNTAFQRLIPDGVCALLPLQNNKMTAVLSLEADKADALNAMTDEALSQYFIDIWGGRFGNMRVNSPRFVYPLKEVYARHPGKGRVILMGNAAHTLNPIAAQGLNLAFRDIAVLNDILEDAKALSKDYGLYVPEIYLTRVHSAHDRMSRVTDFLVNIAYAKTLLPFQGIGLSLLQHVPAVKNKWARTFAGLDR